MAQGAMVEPERPQVRAKGKYESRAGRALGAALSAFLGENPGLENGGTFVTGPTWTLSAHIAWPAW